MKRARQLAPSRQQTKKKQQAQHMAYQETKPRKLPSDKLSAFEKLPNEIIQHIFFDCLEPNLAAASPVLNSILSDESIFRTLILFAFFNDDGESPIEEHQFLPAKYRCLNPVQQEDLQRTMHSYKWLSMSRFENLVPLLRWMAMRQAWHAEAKGERFYEHLPWADSYGLDKAGLVSVAPLPPMDDRLAMEDHFAIPNSGGEMMDGTISGNSQTTQPLLQTWTTEIDYQSAPEARTRAKHPYRSVSAIAVRMIPDKLLRGSPWTDDKVAFLRMLLNPVRGVYPIDPCRNILTDQADAVFDGIKSAMENDRADAFGLLLNALGAFHDDRFAVPLRVLHAATRQGDQSEYYMQQLVPMCKLEEVVDDTMVTAWALSVKHNDKSQFAAELLRDLEYSRPSKE